MKTTPFDPEFEAQLRSAIASDNEDVDLASALAPDDDPLAAPFGPKQFTRGRNRVEGFCVAPLWVVSEIAKARAYHAAPLVLVILQRMRMRRMTVVPITSAIWERVASPREYERRTILDHLRLIPGVLKLEERRRGYTRYQALLGDKWTAKENEE
jgi:hypothetical protein